MEKETGDEEAKAHSTTMLEMNFHLKELCIDCHHLIEAGFCALAILVTFPIGLKKLHLVSVLGQLFIHIIAYKFLDGINKNEISWEFALDIDDDVDSYSEIDIKIIHIDCCLLPKSQPFGLKSTLHGECHIAPWA